MRGVGVYVLGGSGVFPVLLVVWGVCEREGGVGGLGRTVYVWVEGSRSETR